MAQHSYFWDGEVTGDHGDYQQDDLMDAFFRAILGATGNLGVLRYWLDELEVTGSSSPLQVATGGAAVYGTFYQSDQPVAVSVPAPTTGNRTDLIVLRRDWLAQTIRIARVEGPGAALTQIPLVRYEIPLASVLVDSAGAITVTDTRESAQYSTGWPADAVNTEHYVEGNITPYHVPNRYRWQLKDSGSIEPDAVLAGCTWTTAGATYDYWQFAVAANDGGWAYFMVPTGLASLGVNIYLWSVPHVNGAGVGAELVDWDYNLYMGAYNNLLTNINGTTSVDQQFRVNTTVYRDALVAVGAPLPQIGDILLVQVSRNGPVDGYASDMRLLGIELYWYADA